ncbi:hypothetical protein A6P39_005735 [Streptomyces sp. FXJ1.172]|uniref:hypothetical protein n=1 Tax=Streptomyces sp. FXJ1.172 TaxID=710705 RepID=UPI0007CFA922|nr:hypothetical protein [Streptomyces sp. FXJ1.172]WEO93557.1 hypothetical protein A6P39_005735 [Streptomyces sp. FXJ1.172]
MVELILALVVVGVAGVGWRLARYPGGWRYAFSDVHRADRQDLARTRAAVRTLRGTARQEESEARSRVAQAERAYDRRIDTLERKLAQLERPGRGAYDSGLGELTLYRHVLLFKGKEIPLAGLGVRFELARNTDTMYIHLKRPDGRAELSEFAHETFPEDQVRRFGVRIENAVAAENTLRDRRPETIRRTKSELQDARADTADKDHAREALERVRARHSDNPRLTKALAELEAARDRWRHLTGHRPR